jgi:LCP family protein required for cell wall assembly
VPEDRQHPPQYTRYRARRRLLPGREEELGPAGRVAAGARGGRDGRGRLPRAGGTGSRAGWRRWTSRRRVLLGLLGLVVGWLVLSLLLFFISSHFERTSPPSDVASALDPAGFPLTSANNILVLGSDTRQKNSKEPGAEKSGPGRSDTIMLIRTGGGHAARLSIPRDTVIDIPGHGLQKINAAHAFGGPKESIEVIKRWLGVPINHLIEVNFENFPQLIDSMGGVDYTGGCIESRIDGGFSQGGYTLKLPAGTHHLDGKAALALARTRENLCARSQNDLTRQEHQQALFNAMKSRVLSPSSFFRLPWIAWNAPPAIISDMSGPTLLGLFAALGTGGTPPTHVLKPSGTTTLPDGEVGLTVSEAERRAAVARFMSG